MIRYGRRRGAAIVAYLKIKKLAMPKRRRKCTHAHWMDVTEKEGPAMKCRRCGALFVHDTVIYPQPEPPTCPDREHAFVHAPEIGPFGFRCKYCGQERPWLEHV